MWCPRDFGDLRLPAGKGIPNVLEKSSAVYIGMMHRSLFTTVGK